MKIQSFYLLSLGLLFFSCHHSQPANLDSWIGNYEYEEEPIKANAGYAMAMEWSLSIEKQNDSCNGIVEINGQQTYIKVLAGISGDSNSIAVTYESFIDGNIEQFRKHDTLFVLSKKAGKLTTQWKRFEPRLSLDHANECSCFIETAHNNKK